MKILSHKHAKKILDAIEKLYGCEEPKETSLKAFRTLRADVLHKLGEHTDPHDGMGLEPHVFMELAARSGSGKAMLWLGNMYLVMASGKNEARYIARGKIWIQKARDLGHTDEGIDETLKVIDFFHNSSFLYKKPHKTRI